MKQRKNKPTIIYEFLYNSCVHESAYATLSLHKTESGAKKAMNKHKAAKRRAFNKLWASEPELKKYVKFGQHEDWCIGTQELLD